MTRRYFNQSHRQVSEACQEEVAEMMRHPATFAQAKAQVRRNVMMSKEKETLINTVYGRKGRN